MLAGLPYKAWMEDLPASQSESKRKIYEYNRCHPDDNEKMDELIRDILGKTGKNVNILAPFYCDYGKHIVIGDNFFANYNCVILDVAKVSIGNNVMFGPNVSLITAGHPIHPDSRNSGYEYGIEISIGDNTWLGANVVVNPGITIGSNTVIGSGSIVTKDIPDHVIAFGNPCRVHRQITEADRPYYYKNQKFDIDDF